jgi:branched-chain amino acid transport system substrate-binding protein
VHDDIRKYVHEKGNATGDGTHLGTVLYNRGVTNAMIVTEAIRTAQGKFGNKSLTGEEVRWGYENLDITEDRLKELGMAGFVPPLKVSCADHEGDHAVKIQQWDGESWHEISDWIEPMKDILRPMIEESAAQYAQEKGITPRDCSAEG